MRRRFLCGSLAMLLSAGALTAQGQGQGTLILEKAPADRAVPIPKATLDRYLKDMDAKGLATLRMLEGGKYNVNIRRIRNAETALVHPTTIDLWVVLEGSGTMTAGGKLENGKIVGGESNPLKVGDVYFVPAGVPHGVSGVNGSITWLNVRWDTDWPASAEMGAGTLAAPPQSATPPPGSGAPAAGGGAPRPQLRPLEYATTTKAVYIPKEKLDQYRRDMETNNISTLRMIEGGHFNINIRRVKAPSAEVHPVTIDTWVVLEGDGTVAHGFNMQGRNRVEGTGATTPAKPGDVFFIPAALNHGYSALATDAVAWLNIRWDVNWNK